MDVGGALSLPLWGKVAPQGRMRGRCAIAARRRTAVGKFPLISQRAGPLTASPKGKATLASATQKRQSLRSALECL